MNVVKIVTAAFILALCALPSKAADKVAAPRTDLNLVVALDCSWSVNYFDYELQIEGMAAVFADPDIFDAISAGRHGSIHVTVTQWSTITSQMVVVPWTKLENAQQLRQLSERISRLPRKPVEGGTSISSALKHSQTLFSSAPLKADRHVVNIVIDGVNNLGEPAMVARDRLVKQGTTINGLAILNQMPWLVSYLGDRVIGGPGAFAEQASNYYDFAHAFKRKLMREIIGNEFSALPTPETPNRS